MRFRIPGWLTGLSAVGSLMGGAVLYKEYFGGMVYEGEEKMSGRTVLVTGANTGLGKEVTKDIAKRGGRVIMACRDMEKCEATKKEIMEITFNKNLSCRKLDLASLKSIKEFAADINQNETRLDVLINNAGVMGVPKRELTEEGFEMHIGVNYLGPFLLTELLLEKLEQSAPSRIVNVSSISHHKGRMNFDDLNAAQYYEKAKAYAQSKLAVILFTRELAEKVKDKKITTYAVNPGVSKTELGRHFGMNKSSFSSFILTPFWYLSLKTPERGAQTIIYTAVNKDLDQESGKYYEECFPALPSEKAMNMESARRLWLISERWTRNDS